LEPSRQRLLSRQLSAPYFASDGWQRDRAMANSFADMIASLDEFAAARGVISGR